MLAEALELRRGWEGSLAQLVEVSSSLLSSQQLRPPTRPLVVDYRSIGLVSPAVRKRYQWRHLVQLTVGCSLVQQGQPRAVVARQFQPLSTEEILGLLRGDKAPATPASRVNGNPWLIDMANEFAQTLAAGLVAQFKLTHRGEPLVHDSELNTWLRGAMRRIAALYIVNGQVAQFDGAHTLVAQARRPLRAADWALSAFDEPGFRYTGVRLLDPVTCMPTLDCIDIARQIDSELDMKEQQAFEALNATADQFGSRNEEAYSALREFVVRHPVTSIANLKRHLEARDLHLAIPFLASCYGPVLPHHLVQGRLHLCPNCGTPMGVSSLKDHVACTTRQCKSFDAPVASASVRALVSDESVVAKGHVLMYWCGPGLDEVALHDVAAKLQLSVVLYPARDRCDLSIDGGAVGIDVKSHANPFLLAATLDRSIGGLELFDRKIIAVNDQAVSRFPEYLEIARRECGRTDVEITSVSALRRKLRISR